MVSGKEFREGLRRPLPKPRVVPAFTIQSMQKGVVVQGPPQTNILRAKPLRPTSFRKHYIRGDFPIGIEVDSLGTRIAWKVDIKKLDYHHYLPLFIEGLLEVEHPYKFLARQGVDDLINQGGEKVFPVIPQLIIPIKKALNTKNNEVMCVTLRALQKIIKSSDMVGQALVPYYRQLLPVMNLYKDKNVNCGDNIDYSQQRGENVSDLINETLELMERYGGEDAFINIKYMIPTYESCILN